MDYILSDFSFSSHFVHYKMLLFFALSPHKRCVLMIVIISIVLGGSIV